jgi:hypothetical protein
MTWHGVTLRDGTTQAIQGLVRSVDLLTDAMERNREVGRLRLLVSDELRERFARQWRRWQTADSAPDLEEVRKHSEAMRRAWAALDTAATEAGHQPMKPEVRETRNADGKFLALVRTFAEARALANEEDPREREIWTLEAVARVVGAWTGRHWVEAIYQHVPGARVEKIRLTPRGAEFDWQLDNDIPFGHEDRDGSLAHTAVHLRATEPAPPPAREARSWKSQAHGAEA